MSRAATWMALALVILATQASGQSLEGLDGAHMLIPTPADKVYAARAARRLGREAGKVVRVAFDWDAGDRTGGIADSIDAPDSPRKQPEHARVVMFSVGDLRIERYTVGERALDFAAFHDRALGHGDTRVVEVRGGEVVIVVGALQDPALARRALDAAWCDRPGSGPGTFVAVSRGEGEIAGLARAPGPFARSVEQALASARSHEADLQKPGSSKRLRWLNQDKSAFEIEGTSWASIISVAPGATLGVVAPTLASAAELRRYLDTLAGPAPAQAATPAKPTGVGIKDRLPALGR